MERNKIMWKAHLRKLSNIDTGILQRKISVLLDKSKDILGYTSDGNKIYLNPENELIPKKQAEAIKFVDGVNFHELGHQLYTDFKYHQKIIKRMEIDDVNKLEISIYHQLFNAIEDASIEYWLSFKLRNKHLSCLEFSKAYIWEKSPNIDNESPFEQFFNAIINYGDIGLVKGDFTDPQAEKIFYDILPIYDKIIEEPSAKKREEGVKEIFNKSRPLWENDLKNIEDFLNNISEQMEGNGTGDFAENASESLSSSDDSSKNKNVDKTKKRRSLSKEKIEKSIEKKKSSDTAEGTDEPSGSEERNENEDFQNDSDDKGNFTQSRLDLADNSISEYNSECENVAEEATISEEEIKEIIDENNSNYEKYKKELEKEVDNTSPDEFDISSKYFIRKARCQNINVQVDNSEYIQDKYNEIVSEMFPGIKRLTNSLRKLKTINEEKLHKTSGRKINFERLNNGSHTARIFDKKSIPNDTDLAIFLLLDESGSMCGRIKDLQKTAIAIAEVCNNVKIPLYVMGFSADIGKYDANHFHYIKWKNTRRTRLSLMSISAKSDNLDGYSIRYAEKVLAKRKENNKLLIVISDGQPAAGLYKNYTSGGVADTKEAVRVANKTAVVQGVSVGGSDTDIIHEIYGVNYVENTDTTKLLTDLGKIIEKRLR